MKKSCRQLTAKVLCAAILAQLGAAPVQAGIGSNGTFYADGYEEYIFDEDPYETYPEDKFLASSSDAGHSKASGSNIVKATGSNMVYQKSEGKVYRNLEEDKENFVLGTVSEIAEDSAAGNVLQITSGWNQDKLKGVAEFKNANELFNREQFTLQAYVYYEGHKDNKKKDSAFAIGEKKNYFSVNLAPGALKYAAGGGKEKIKDSNETFKQKWISLSISYQEDEKEGYVTICADGEELIPSTGIGFKLTSLDNVKAYVGGTFADTSYMGAGIYDSITVYDWADAGNSDGDLATASDAAESLEEKAESFDFSEKLNKVTTQKDAETALGSWLWETCGDIMETGVSVRPLVYAYKEPGEPFRESFEGAPGNIVFAFKVFSGSASAVTNEIQAEIKAMREDLGEIPVYESFSGAADGTGSKNYNMWLDTEGKHIQAHGGQVQGLNEAEVQYDLDGNGAIEDKNVWLWYGEDKTRNGRPIDGVRCYVSTDLYNWTDKGTVLRTHDMIPAKLGEGEFAEDGVSLDEDAYEQIKVWAEMEAPTDDVSQNDIDMAKNFVEAYADPSSASGYDEENMKLAFWNLYTGYCIVERPKMLYNEASRQYVVVYHQDAPAGDKIANWLEELKENPDSTNTGSRYSRASMGFAVSDSPFGPFKLVNVQRMNGYPEQFSSKPGMARDMNVFLDDTDIDQNGVPDAYAIYSSEENRKLYISLLNEAYTGPATEGAEDTMELSDGSKIKTFATRVLADDNREAPALFKYDGWYYMITSGTSGWNPNKATYYRSQNIFGPWEGLGDPCEGGSGTTFRSQSTSVIPVDPENGKYIYMGDRWRTEGNSSALWYSSYMWVPVEFTEDHKIRLKNEENWKLELLDEMTPIQINTKLPDTMVYGKDTGFPKVINVTKGGKTFDTPVTWEFPTALGTQSVKGILTEIGREIFASVNVVLDQAVYFVDSGAKSAEGRDYFNKIVEISGNTMKNKNSADRAYSEGSWGYEGNNTVARSSGSDVYEMLRYVQKNTQNHDISYRFDNLEAGTYEILVGFYDPWYQYSKGKRKAEITIEVDEHQVNGAVAHTITDAKDMVSIPKIELKESGDIQVNLKSVNQGNDTDVMVSYLAVCKVDKETEQPERETYTVRFETAGGTAVSDQKIKEGELVQKPEDPVRQGYIFEGWYKDGGYTESWDFAADVVKENTTIYAKWKPEEPEQPEAAIYTVRFETAGGTAVSDQKIKEGELVQKPEDPVRQGYIFEGWYKDDRYTESWDFAAGVVTKDTIIYAKWKKYKPSDHEPVARTSDGKMANTAVLTVTAPAGNLQGSWNRLENGKWQFTKDNGKKARSEWGLINGAWYLFKQNAEMATGWAMVNGIWYYLEPSTGAMATGWQHINGKWYYLEIPTGRMKTGTVVISGVKYELGADGSWIE